MNRRRLLLTLAEIVIGGLVLGTVSGAVLRATNVRAAAWYLIALAILLLALGWLARFALVHTESPRRPDHGPTHGRAVPMDVLGPSERRLSAAARERRLYLAGLQPRLLDMARERVRLRSGTNLDRAIRDGTARDILGDELWHWLTIWDEDGPPPTPAQLDHLVTALERL